MNLEKLFGSKTKSDILKYLVFRRQGVSIRSLESELGWTFPGIKKQIDSLEEAEVLHVDKSPEKRSISIAEDSYDDIRRLIISSLKHDIKSIFGKFTDIISAFYFGKIFDKQIDVDLVILFEEKNIVEISTEDTTKEIIDADGNKPLDTLKSEIMGMFKAYMIDPASLVFMKKDEFEKRSKMADKFALSVLRSVQ